MALTALEYLVIGRSLLDGYPLYHFVCSRSFGFYYIIAIISPDRAEGHVGVSVLIALLFGATLLATFIITFRRLGALVPFVPRCSLASARRSWK